jgi:hypothetical protein
VCLRVVQRNEEVIVPYSKTRLPQKRVVPDRLDLRDRPYLPDLSQPPPPRLNALTGGRRPAHLLPHHQGDTNACTGFALARVIDLLLIRAGRPAEIPVSPFMLYSMARRYDEFPGYTADEGSSLRGALKGWYKHGACHGRFWKKAPMPPPATRAEDDWWQDAIHRPLGAYYRVDTRSVTDMHVALNQAGALYASAVCHLGWDEGHGGGARRRANWVIPQRKATDEDGGHAFAIVGYDARGFLLLNSWGDDWGAGGLATLTYEDWLDNAMDCWVGQLGVETEQHREVAKAVTLRTERSRVTISSQPTLRDREISPFVVNVQNNGTLSDSGVFRTNPDDLTALVTTHLKEARKLWGKSDSEPIDVAVYAHGGLVSEETAAATAAAWIPALYDAQIFPVFLMWETDLWSTIKNRLSDVVHGWSDADPRPTSGLRDQLQRMWNQRVERSLAQPGSFLWDEMKQNAEAISASRRSGAVMLHEKGLAAGTLVPRKVRLHLVGHSAGAIVHSHVIDALQALGWTFSSVTFLAPAVRCDVFDALVKPHLGKAVARYHQFHLTDEVEQKDPTCRPIVMYGRSLLYLVSESFERNGHRPRTPGRAPILGLERDFETYRAHSAVQVFASPSTRSQSSTHGDFDNDTLTRKSVIALMQKAAGR